MTYVGRSVPRVEDGPLLTGAGRFLDDLDRPGQLHARIVRSEVAHGRIAAVHAGAARERPGVVRVITAEDVPDIRIPVRMMPSNEAVPVTQPPLARGVVRYVGEPLAVVLAADPYSAEDAVEHVRVEVESLEPLVDAPRAGEHDAPALHDGALSGNVVNTLRSRWGRDAGELLREADVVVSDRLRIQRHAAIPLETRGLLADFDGSSGRLTLWGPTKVKHFNRTLLAGFLGLAEEAVRFIEPDVGGGFGARGEFYPEDFLVPWLAMQLGRPVKWVEDRREHFVAINHSRETWCDFEIGATADGRLLGFRASCLVDQGAYARTHGTVLLPWVLVHHLAGPYVWEGLEIEARSVLTNKTPSGTYRGPGQYEAAFFRERMIDRLAAALEIDSAELRSRNLIRSEAMPYRMELSDITPPVVYDNGDFPQVVSTLLARSSYERLRAEVHERRARGELVGIGMAAYVEETAFGRHEYAWIVPREEGGWVAHVGIASLGQGVRTALAQVVADQLQVDIEDVEISHRDTDLVPQGFGAYASRTTIVGGGAVVGAVADLKRKALSAAADQLEIAEGDLEFGPGAVVHPRGNPTRGIPIAELGCTGHHRFDKPLPSFDMGACLAQVAVDGETGAVSVLRILVCQDVGQAVNPQLVDGQLVGGAAQGVGGVLFEELAYDPAGQPQATSFMDYLMPTAAEVPPIDTVQLELPHWDEETANPIGAKAAGEGGIVGSGAAIANAVADALGDHDALSHLPLTPDAMLALASRRPQREGVTTS
ncbi:MAG TPA: xanthine dehydrogenase family protein molybdopterin-binding subunit [Thermoleophilaceae bacterium]|nr:xanthine dehydrogenase family protein molybdopterin-binding subunit [Thermoleophilaceae bacterium]